MKLVVTGALGHIGSRLIRSLPRVFPSPTVIMLDDLSSQRYPALFQLPPDGCYRFIEGDILSTDLVAFFEGADVVVHLAARTDAEGSVSIPEIVTRVNVDGTRLVAEACAQTGAKMIFLSTTSVYGRQAGVVDEECPVEELRPQSPYARSKLEAEHMLAELARRGSLRYTVCRFGTIFGSSPGMRFHTAVNKFIWQAVMGHPITVWRSALRQRRPYLDLTDAVAAIAHIVRRDLFAGVTYNVSTTNLTVEDVVGAIEAAVGRVEVSFVDSEIMNQLSYNVSSQRFIDTGFSFAGDLRLAVEDTVRILSTCNNLRA